MHNNIEQVILVDEQDQQIGVQEKIAAHKNAELHRAFSVFLVRENNQNIEILLQQRANCKYHCPGLWTNSCCSHPRPGETIEQASERRVQEELGIKIRDFNYAGSFVYKAEFDNGLTEHEFDHVVVARIDDYDFSNANPHEVSDVKWVVAEELLSIIESEPSKYTPWLAQAYRVSQNLLQFY